MTTPQQRHQIISDIEHDLKTTKDELIVELINIIENIVVKEHGIIGIAYKIYHFHTTFNVNGSKVDALIVDNDNIDKTYYVLILESGFRLPLDELNIYDLINLYYYFGIEM